MVDDGPTNMAAKVTGKNKLQVSSPVRIALAGLRLTSTANSSAKPAAPQCGVQNSGGGIFETEYK